MKFMNLFTGKTTTETCSTRNIKTNPNICYSDRPNDECSSIDKIRKLQDEIKSLQEEKGELNSKSAYDVIHNINKSDRNIIRKYVSPYVCIHDHEYNEMKEIEKLWLDFTKLFKLMEDKSKEEIIYYLKNQKELDQKIDDCNHRINNLKVQIRLEKEKLGIE